MTTVKELLEALGDTREKVTENLKSLNIRGKRLKPAECPLAVYIKKKLGGECLVGCESVWTNDERVCALPAGCHAFRAYYDYQGIPELTDDS